MRYKDVSALYAAVGEGHVSAQTVVQLVRAVAAGRERTGRGTHPAEATAASTKRLRQRPRRRRQGRHRRVGQAGPVLHADAGRPDPGFVTHGNGVSVHRADCVNSLT